MSSEIIQSVGWIFIGLLALEGKDIVFRFIIEYSSSLRDFYRPLGNSNIIGLF
jgi:hypothetical protein